MLDQANIQNYWTAFNEILRRYVTLSNILFRIMTASEAADHSKYKYIFNINDTFYVRIL